MLLALLTHTSEIKSRYFSSETLEVTNSYASLVGQFLNNDIINSTGVFVFWMLIGSLTYGLIGLSIVIVHAYMSDKPLHVHHYVRTKADQDATRDVFMRFVLRSAGLAGFVFWVALNAAYVLRWLDAWTSDGLVNLNPVAGALLLGVGSLDVFACILMLRLSALRTRLFWV